MPSAPETQYAKSGDVNIAYQVVGDGSLDLVYVSGWVSNLELMWDEPQYERFLRRLASFSRLIVFDKRGTGLSDPVALDHLPTLEQRMDDVRAVMDAVGSERAAVFGNSEGGQMSLLFAATYPERTVALVTQGTFAKRLWSPDYPWAPTPEAREQEIRDIEASWADLDVTTLAPSTDDAFRRRLAAYFRRSASPAVGAAFLRMNTQADLRAVLPTIRVPTLVIHRTDDRDVDVEEGRWIAARIPGARYVEVPGIDHVPWVGNQDEVLDEIEEFLTGARPAPEPDRVLATVLFTDIAGSTMQAAELGDRRWRALLERHDRLVREEVDRQRGRFVKSLGDGALAVFDGPSRAISSATAIRNRVRDLGLEIRAGLHTGECELLADDDVGGLAVHIGARISGLAGPSEVLVSSTVRDLIVGSGQALTDRGEHDLKGVPGPWRIYAVAT
jgi:pimeloyl-ACP methyl ester carboxylesterase